MTRDPKEHNENLEIQSEEEYIFFEVLGSTGFTLCWQSSSKACNFRQENTLGGSLNILSQIKSREIMRRIENKKLTVEMFNFLKFEKFI